MINKAMPRVEADHGGDRRTRAAILDRVVSENAPMTVRQVFYQLVGRGAIEQVRDREYHNVVVRLARRRCGSKAQLPWGWITDGTRWMHKSVRYGSVEEALEATTRHYRRDYWRELDEYVEVWLEKDALAGVLFRVTDEWGVPLMVTRGFASLSYVHNAAETIERVGKPTHIYYFGDYDPSGVEIDRNLERRLREFAPYSEIHFERVAVRREQIDEYDLPTRPTKRERQPRTRPARGRERGGRRAPACDAALARARRDRTPRRPVAGRRARSCGGIRT